MKRLALAIVLLIATLAIVDEMRVGRCHREAFAAPSPSETYCIYFYGFNTALPPTDDARVRRALSLAVDREAWASRPDVSAAKTLGYAGDASEAPGIAFDPELARRELELAGYPGGAGFPRITLMFNASEPHQKIAQTIQANWKEHLGIDVELVSREWNGYLGSLGDGAPNVWRLSSGAEYADTVLRLFHSTTGAKLSSWSNSEFDRLLELILIEPDCARREELYRRAEQILTAEDAAVIPVIHYPFGTDLDLGPMLYAQAPSMANATKVRPAEIFPLGNDEVLVLENVADADVDLSGWQVQNVDRVSGDVLHTYVFEAGYILPVGEKVFIHSGPAAQTDPSAYLHLLWLSLPVWNDAGNLAVIRDDQGDLQTSCAYEVTSTDWTEAAEMQLLPDQLRVCRLGARIEF